MPAPIDMSTLEAIGGQKTARSVQGFADTMMNLYSQKKQAEMMDIQMKGMQQQQDIAAKEEEVNAQAREYTKKELAAKTELLPLQTKNALTSELVKAKEIETQAFDATLAQAAQVKGAKSYRRWLADNADVLKKHFDSEEEYQDFIKQPWNPKSHQTAIDHWRLNKPDMIDKRLMLEWEAKLAAAKTTSGPDVGMPSVTDFSNMFKDSSVPSGLAGPAALVARDLLDATKNIELPLKIGQNEAFILAKRWAEEIESERSLASYLPFTDKYEMSPEQQLQMKRDVFISDMQNNRGDAYISILSGIPVADIAHLKEINPTYSTSEIYNMILSKNKGK